MPKINIYLPDDLAAAVKAAGIPVSAVCQRALTEAVAEVDAPLADPPDAAGATGQSPALSRFTQRARRAIELAKQRAESEDRTPDSLDVVRGLITEGGSLALVVLKTIDVDPDDLLSESEANYRTSKRGKASTPSTLDEVLQAAHDEALGLGHNYIGCEHLLLALAAGPATDPVAQTLHTLGIDQDRARSAVRAALSGINYAQGNAMLSGLSSPVKSILEEIRQRLSRLEPPAGPGPRGNDQSD
ncbi:MAG: peptidase [Frankiales bacterium]|nr:peptidase [Frankiales bacterium]